MLIERMQSDFVHEDERGRLTQIVHDGYRQVNVITSHAGVERGGHYHKLNNEAFYIVSGKLELEATLGSEREVATFGEGSLFGIGPNVMHSFRFLEETTLVSFYSSGVELADGTKDIYSD